MLKSEKILIVGQSGSGKDHLMRKLAEKGLKPCLKWTTRPSRKFEQQGITYNFVDDDKFITAINENKFLSYQKFEVTPENSDILTWYYGVTIEEFTESQVFIMTPSELKDLTLEMRKECFVVFLDIDRSVRERRLLRRDDKNDSITRRLDADELDFKESFDFDLRVTDPEFGVEDVYSLMN
jgi:guanylate kinase